MPNLLFFFNIHTVLSQILFPNVNRTTTYFYLELKEGQVSGFILRIGDTITEKEPVFVITGNYGTYRDIFEGKIGTAMALLKNRIKLKGSKFEALKIIKQLDGLIGALRQVTDEFEA